MQAGSSTAVCQQCVEASDKLDTQLARQVGMQYSYDSRRVLPITIMRQHTPTGANQGTVTYTVIHLQHPASRLVTAPPTCQYAVTTMEKCLPPIARARRMAYSQGVWKVLWMFCCSKSCKLVIMKLLLSSAAGRGAGLLTGKAADAGLTSATVAVVQGNCGQAAAT
jgi:hypothetical protein